MKMRQTAHFSPFEVNATNFYCVFSFFLSENYRLAFWTLKTEEDPFVKKKNENKKNKSSVQEGESVCSGDGGGEGRTKKISPKDAMHLVVVL